MVAFGVLSPVTSFVYLVSFSVGSCFSSFGWLGLEAASGSSAPLSDGSLTSTAFTTMSSGPGKGPVALPVLVLISFGISFTDSAWIKRVAARLGLRSFTFSEGSAVSLSMVVLFGLIWLVGLTGSFRFFVLCTVLSLSWLIYVCAGVVFGYYCVVLFFVCNPAFSCPGLQ